MSNNIKFCVINCENSKRWSPISFSDMFLRGLQQKEDVNIRSYLLFTLYTTILNFWDSLIHSLIVLQEIWDVYNIASGESLPTSDTMIETYRGIIITGSHFNVRDRLQYIDTDRFENTNFIVF